MPQAQLAMALPDRWTLEGYLNMAGLPEVPAPLKGIYMPEEMFDEPFRVEPHQITGLNAMLRHERFGLYDEPGVGKTLPAMAYAAAMAAHGNKTVLVMPPVLVWQMWDAFDVFFPGLKERFKFHWLKEGFYPVKVAKSRAQKIRRDLHVGKLTEEQIMKAHGIDRTVLNLVRNMPEIADIPFLKDEVRWVREADYRKIRKAEIAKRVGCTEGAVTNLRNQIYLQDLFDDWRYNGWPDILLMSHQRYLTVADRLARRYRAMVIDEAHLIGMCNASSKMHRRVVGFCNENQKRHGNVGLVLMTGTPAPNNVSDLYGLISLTNPRAYSNEANFRALHLEVEHIVREGTGNRTVTFEVITGYKNLDYLNATLYANARRVRKEQVFSLDKPRIIQERISLSPEHMDAYEEIIKEMVLVADDAVIDLSQYQKLRMAAAQAAVAPEAVIPDFRGVNHVRQWIEELLQSLAIGNGEKIAIFGHFVSTIELVAHTWLKAYNPAVINSSVSDTSAQVRKFLHDDSCSVAVIHPRSGGVGLNLQSVCRYVAFVEPTSVPGDFIQASERVYRKGQSRVVNIYLPHVIGTVLPKKIQEMLGKFDVTNQTQGDRNALLAELRGR